MTGLDLVEVQLSLATGGTLPTTVEPIGHAIQARLYAEDPLHDFAPSPGEIRILDWPDLPGLRIDAGYESGDVVPSFYDAMIGKLIVHAGDRGVAIDLLAAACDDLLIGGIATNRAWLRSLTTMDEFRDERHTLATAEHVAVAEEPTSSLAALASALLPEDGGSAWTSVGPFRIVAPASVAIHDVDGAWSGRVEYTREPAGWQAVVGGTVVETDTPAVVIDTDDGFEINDPTGRWLVRLGPLSRMQAESEQADGALSAPMPGTVVAVNVTTGQAVRQGEVLAVMTAMKMEMALAAPFDGVVASVGCAVGDLVGSRQVLVSVVPNNESEAGDG